MSKRKKASIVVISSLCTLSLLLMIMYIQGFIPFGNDKSLASMDAHIQYIDLYAYLKDVILGKNNFSYTFSNVLGGSSFAIFSYYLSSPINLLVIFFSMATSKSGRLLKKKAKVFIYRFRATKGGRLS